VKKTFPKPFCHKKMPERKPRPDPMQQRGNCSPKKKKEATLCPLGGMSAKKRKKKKTRSGAKHPVGGGNFPARVKT